MKTLELKVPPLALVLITAALMWVLSVILPALSIGLSASWPITFIALAVALIGAVFCVLGVWEFRKMGTTVDPRVPEQLASLVVRGVYRVSRNPMYVGFLFFLIAWGVFLNNFISLVLLLAFVMYMNRFQIAPEERQLRKTFGDAYRQYENGVRRWL